MFVTAATFLNPGSMVIYDWALTYTPGSPLAPVGGTPPPAAAAGYTNPIISFDFTTVNASTWAAANVTNCGAAASFNQQPATWHFTLHGWSTESVNPCSDTFITNDAANGNVQVFVERMTPTEEANNNFPNFYYMAIPSPIGVSGGWLPNGIYFKTVVRLTSSAFNQGGGVFGTFDLWSTQQYGTPSFDMDFDEIGATPPSYFYSHIQRSTDGATTSDLLATNQDVTQYHTIESLVTSDNSTISEICNWVDTTFRGCAGIDTPSAYTRHDRSINLTVKADSNLTPPYFTVNNVDVYFKSLQVWTCPNGATQTCAPASPLITNWCGNSLTGSACSASGSGPCDIYASAGTPCVAAHSTTRALYSVYSGPLYQVKRSSDNTTKDIGLLSVGGYANAASQDSFCASTSCIISKIYDQSPQHNDLGVGNTNNAAVANALPIVIAGHNVYGVDIEQGTGYDNRGATGTATGSQPEGTYMVTSRTNTNQGCCFDYGNAERTQTAAGNGHMDAVYFGSLCWGPSVGGTFTCNGGGPWVMADLENGLFSSDIGSSENSSDTGVPYAFVTAMIKNNGVNFWARKSGNAQSGGLTTWFSGILPTVQGGYSPMAKEGGIVLGTGGDDTKFSTGYFFEGVMTSGLPTDATDDAVQANIVSVGYH